MYAHIDFKVKESPSASSQIMIQHDAIVSQGELQGVYTISSSNTAILNWLRLGKKQGDMVEVISVFLKMMFISSMQSQDCITALQFVLNKKS